MNSRDQAGVKLGRKRGRSRKKRSMRRKVDNTSGSGKFPLQNWLKPQADIKRGWKFWPGVDGKERSLAQTASVWMKISRPMREAWEGMEQEEGQKRILVGGRAGGGRRKETFAFRRTREKATRTENGKLAR